MKIKRIDKTNEPCPVCKIKVKQDEPYQDAVKQGDTWGPMAPGPLGNKSWVTIRYHQRCYDKARNPLT